MTTTRRAALRSMGATVLLLGARDLAFGASIVAVRVWPAADYTRITIESNSPLAEKHFLAETPSRLVIDIDGLELSPALRELVGKVRADDPFIAGVRVGQNQPRVVRLVIDLKQPTAPQLFTLAPVAAYQHRLVFDLFPTRERDPLLALIRERETAEQQAAKSVQDALGEFIGKVDKPLLPPSAAASAGPPLAALPTPAPVPTPIAPPQLQTPAPLSPLAQVKIDRLVVVAIDPGHGGEDPGAVGPSGLREKDVVLAVALQLRDRINALPNMRAMLTRDADFFVPLQERVHKARRVQADLFVSIHADAFLTPQARGASVFALSQGGASSSAARWMANRENSADMVGGININAKDANVMRAMLDMSTTAQIRDSLKLGGEVLGQIGKVGRLHKGAVEQAGFAVLKAPDIPSILVESAFISNPEEEARLRDPQYQAQLVHALAIGIQRYFAKNPPLARSRQLWSQQPTHGQGLSMLHPQTRALLDLIEQRQVPPTHTLSVADARAYYRDRRSVTQPAPPEVALVRDLQASGPAGPIPLRLYRPMGSSDSALLPVLVYYHGGGWVIGDLDTHDSLCRALANEAGCAVVAVDYRLSPEHRFPAAVHDAIAAARWVHAHAAELKLDASRLAVGGDSAGGNLATVVSIAARDSGDLPIRFQLLIYPGTDQRRGAPSHTTNGQGYLLTADTIAYFVGHYIPDAAQYNDWRASPLLHTELSKLPPALVLTAGYDPLRDEGAAYAEALTAAGNRASYVCFERQIHGFITMGKVLDEANVAVTMCAAELRRALSA